MNMRDLKEMMLVTAGGAVGVVASWNRSSVFVHFWDAENGCFEANAAGCARDQVEPGGSVSWKPKAKKPDTVALPPIGPPPEYEDGG